MADAIGAVVDERKYSISQHYLRHIWHLQVYDKQRATLDDQPGKTIQTRRNTNIMT